MAMRGRSEPKNHNIILLSMFTECCLSGPCLEKYKRDCNETWFIDRWQYGQGHYTITIILPCIFTELSPLYHLVL